MKEEAQKNKVISLQHCLVLCFPHAYRSISKRPSNNDRVDSLVVSALSYSPNYNTALLG